MYQLCGDIGFDFYSYGCQWQTKFLIVWSFAVASAGWMFYRMNHQMIGQNMKLFGKWPMTDYYFWHCVELFVKLNMPRKSSGRVQLS